MIIKPNPIDKYRILYDLPKGTWMVINMGGRGGGKSYESSKYVTLKAICEGKRTVVLRDEKTSITESILNEIKNRFTEINTKSNGYFTTQFDMQENSLKKRAESKSKDPNQGSLIFTKGFKASSSEKVAHLKSISDVDIALIEELEDIRDEDKFNTFADSIRNEGSIIMINSNVGSKEHWFIRRYFRLEPTEYEGYFNLVPKDIEGIVYIMTTYEDNPFLTERIVKKYRAYGDPNSEFYDLHYYLTAILGYASSGLRGAIYKNWNRISLAEYNNLDYNKYYYLDWGTNDECAIGEVKIHNRTMLVKGLHYNPTKKKDDLVLDVAIFLAQKGFTQKENIICDSSQPRSIMQLRSGYSSEDVGEFILEQYPQLRIGFSAIGIEKPKGSVVDGINILKAYDVYVVEDEQSEHIWNEYLEYAWEIDKDGNPTDQPIDKNNHHMDGIRYVGYYKDRL